VVHRNTECSKSDGRLLRCLGSSRLGRATDRRESMKTYRELLIRCCSRFCLEVTSHTWTHRCLTSPDEIWSIPMTTRWWPPARRRRNSARRTGNSCWLNCCSQPISLLHSTIKVECDWVNASDKNKRRAVAAQTAQSAVKYYIDSTADKMNFWVVLLRMMKHGFIIIHQKEMQWKHVSSPIPKKFKVIILWPYWTSTAIVYIWIIMTSLHDVINKTMVGGVH